MSEKGEASIKINGGPNSLSNCLREDRRKVKDFCFDNDANAFTRVLPDYRVGFDDLGGFDLL
jgi:hypothetical protein